jgi:hypothetical protein
MPPLAAPSSAAATAATAAVASPPRQSLVAAPRANLNPHMLRRQADGSSGGVGLTGFQLDP